MSRAGVVRLLLRVYKLGPGAVFLALGARCRHEPSCSVYGADCVTRHGWWPGAWMTLARLQRCRPGGSSGYDPCPEELREGSVLTPWKYGVWKMPKTSAYETYAQLDLGPGGYASGPASQSRDAAREAIERGRGK